MKIKFTVISLFFISIISLNVESKDNEIKHMIILQGFQNVKVGYEISGNNYQAALLFSGGQLNKNYYQLDLQFSAGKILYKNIDIYLPVIVSIDGQYSHETSAAKKTVNWSYSLNPAVGLSIYKQFGKVIIGGVAMLNLWGFQKYYSYGYNSGWNATRRFSIDPDFIFGYTF